MPMDPDTAFPPPQPYLAVTLGGMAARKWEMQARCGRCKVVLRVDVRALVTLHGADTLWWGRRANCRVANCRGRVTFWARSVTYGSWKSLGRSLTARDIEMGRRAEAKPQPKPPLVAVDWRKANDWLDG